MRVELKLVESGKLMVRVSVESGRTETKDSSYCSVDPNGTYTLKDPIVTFSGFV